MAETGERSKCASRGAGGFALAVALCVCGPVVMAAELQWPAGTYKYITVDQSVSDALVELGRNIGTPVRVSPKVRGRLTAGMPLGTAKDFLEWVCNRYGLVWFFDGSVIHVSAESEMRTEVLKIEGRDAEDLAARLASLDVTDPRFPVQAPAGGNLVSVSGPPAYVDLVKGTLGILTGPANSRLTEGAQDAAAVRVFRGRSATAQTVPAASQP